MNDPIDISTINITTNRQLRRVRRIFRKIRQQGKRQDQKIKKIRQKEIEALQRRLEFIDPVDKEKFENIDDYINEMLKGEIK